MHLESVLKELEALPDRGDVYISDLKPLLKKIKKDHALACELWQTGNRAARHIAVRVADPKLSDENLLEDWVRDLEDWGLTDAFTGHLVKYTSFAVSKAFEWAIREPEFERRAGFATIAQMAWARNDFEDEVFLRFLSVIEKTATDDRFYVKKATNWALRDIGKRNIVLRKQAQALALKLQTMDNKTACWVGRHRSREIMD